MAGGRVIFTDISSSRRFNRLFQFGESGCLAQRVYFFTYPHSDNWGHIPFNEETIKLRTMPGYPGTLEDLLYAMCLLVHVKLWEQPYCVNNELYVHIFNFELKNIDGIRKRLKGIWPDESGVVPVRERNNKVFISIQDCIAKAANIRAESTLYIDPLKDDRFSGIFRKIQEYSVQYHHELTLKPEKFCNTHDKLSHLFYNITVNGQQLSPSFLIKLFTILGKDIDQVGRVLFRARYADNVIGYIQSGLNSGWILSPTTEEDVAPAVVREWIDNLFGFSNPRGTAGLSSIDNLIGGLLDD